MSSVRFCLRNRLFAVLFAAAGLAISSAASAETYPSRPITLVVPFPPGGVIDGTARVLEPALSAALGRPVVIENKGGSGGNLGVASVARAAPDGYTLLITPNATVVINPFMFKSYPIDPTKDLAPITMIGETYIGLVVQTSSPINSVEQLLSEAKAKPGVLTFGHVGVGSGHYIAGALLNKKAGVQIVPVPFKGAGPAMQDLLGGHITMSYGTMSAILPFLETGQMKLLALAESKRIKQMPNVPTIAETVPGVVSSTWLAFFAPPGTPKAIIDRLNEVMKNMLESAEVREKLGRIGVVATPGTAGELGTRIQEDLKFWREAIATVRLEPQ